MTEIKFDNQSNSIKTIRIIPRVAEQPIEIDAEDNPTLYELDDGSVVVCLAAAE